MDKVAEQILVTETVTDAQGNSHPLHSQTVRAQCEILQQVIREHKPQVSLEVGLAFGISTLFICEALEEVGARTHIVMDPFQEEEWQGIGLKNIKQAGYDTLVDFRPQYSHQVLPQLLQEGVKINFAYVDTTKLFDVVLVDAYYLCMLLNVGGILFIDDCTGKGIRKVCRFLARHPSWEVFSLIGAGEDNWKENLLGGIARRLPKAHRMFANNILDTDTDLGVNAHCIGFRKIKEDDRHWSWFEDF